MLCLIKATGRPSQKALTKGHLRHERGKGQALEHPQPPPLHVPVCVHAASIRSEQQIEKKKDEFQIGRQ